MSRVRPSPRHRRERSNLRMTTRPSRGPGPSTAPDSRAWGYLRSNLIFWNGAIAVDARVGPAFFAPLIARTTRTFQYRGEGLMPGGAIHSASGEVPTRSGQARGR